MASASADRHDRQLSMSLDEVKSNDAVEAIPMLRPDDVAAAVLLGTAFEKHRAGLARLQDLDAITVIEVASAELVNPIARLLAPSRARVHRDRARRLRAGQGVNALRRGDCSHLQTRRR